MKVKIYFFLIYLHVFKFCIIRAKLVYSLQVQTSAVHYVVVLLVGRHHSQCALKLLSVSVFVLY